MTDQSRPPGMSTQKKVLLVGLGCCAAPVVLGFCLAVILGLFLVDDERVPSTATPRNDSELNRQETRRAPTALKTDPWEHLSAAVERSNEATQILNSAPPGELPRSTYEAAAAKWRLALEELRMIDPAALNSHDPGLGDAVVAYFMKGLELRISAKTTEESINGQMLLARWGEELSRRRQSYRK